MKVEINIDSDCKETKVVVHTDKINDQVNELVKNISEETFQIIVGFKEDRLEILEETRIIRFYSLNKKVFATTAEGEYIVRMRLYEIEGRVDNQKFVRISNSEIINIKKVKNLDLSFAGTICIVLENSVNTYVSRRYVTHIKNFLGIGGK